MTEQQKLLIYWYRFRVINRRTFVYFWAKTLLPHQVSS